MEFRHGWIQGFCYIIRILSLSIYHLYYSLQGIPFSQEVLKIIPRSLHLPSSATSAKRELAK